MSTIQEKIIREQIRLSKTMGKRVMTKSELKQIVRKLNYPQVYGELHEKIIAQLKKMGIEKKR